MAWDIKSVKRSPAADTRLAQKAMAVEFEFVNLDAQGNIIDVHMYVEPIVSDVSYKGLAQLARQQLAQLERVRQTPQGLVFDLTGIKALIADPSMSEETAQAIAKHVDWTKDDTTIAATLNAATVDNPVATAPLVPPVIEPLAVLGLLSNAEKKAVMESNAMPAISDALENNKNVVVTNLAAGLAAAGTISPSSYQAVAAAVASKPDPDWTPKVSQAALILQRPVTPADVKLARALAVVA